MLTLRNTNRFTLPAFLAIALLCGPFANAQTAQPSTPTYNVDALATVQIYNQASYLTAFKTSAPEFDVTKPAKNWIDGKAAADLASGKSGKDWLSYQVFDNGQWVPYYSTRADAASINLKPQLNAATNLDPALKKALEGPYLPFPARELLPNEKLTQTPFGQWIVQRLDLQPTSTTGTDSQTLAQILVIVQRLAAALNVPLQ